MITTAMGKNPKKKKECDHYWRVTYKLGYFEGFPHVGDKVCTKCGKKYLLRYMFEEIEDEKNEGKTEEEG